MFFLDPMLLLGLDDFEFSKNDSNHAITRYFQWRQQSLACKTEKNKKQTTGYKQEQNMLVNTTKIAVAYL